MFSTLIKQVTAGCGVGYFRTRIISECRYVQRAKAGYPTSLVASDTDGHTCMHFKMHSTSSEHI